MADNVHGRFGGDEHYELIQKSLHKIVDRYYEKNARIAVENETLEFRSTLGSRGIGGRFWSEKELHPDIVVQMEPGEAGMETQKTVVVECETSTNNLLTNTVRLATYTVLREGQDKNELMIYLAFPEALRGKVEKPDWANDLWFFEVGGERRDA